MIVNSDARTLWLEYPQFYLYDGWPDKEPAFTVELDNGTVYTGRPIIGRCIISTLGNSIDMEVNGTIIRLEDNEHVEL